MFATFTRSEQVVRSEMSRRVATSPSSSHPSRFGTRIARVVERVTSIASRNMWTQQETGCLALTCPDASFQVLDITLSERVESSYVIVELQRTSDDIPRAVDSENALKIQAACNNDEENTNKSFRSDCATYNSGFDKDESMKDASILSTKAVRSSTRSSFTNWTIPVYTSLRDIIAHCGTFDRETTKFMIAKLLFDVYHMNLAGRVHCNINPDTVVLDEDGDLGLRDFSNSVYFPTRKFTKTDPVLRYPPQPRDVEYPKGVYNPRFAYADYHGIGSVMFHMRTGLKSRFPPCGSVLLNHDEYSRAEYDFLSRLVTPYPKKRFKSVEEMMRHEVFDGVNWLDFYTI